MTVMFFRAEREKLRDIKKKKALKKKQKRKVRYKTHFS
jgi:hypothetical protein